jgi:hypothetical protein
MRFRTIPAILVLLLFGGFVLSAYSASFPLYFVRRCGWDLVVFLWIVAAAFGVGRVILLRIARSGTQSISRQEKGSRNTSSLSCFPAFEEACLSASIGLGVLAYTVLAINLLHVLRLSVVVPVMLILGVFGLREIWRWRTDELLPRLSQRSPRGDRPRWKIPPVFRWVVYTCIGIPLAISLFMACGPVCQSDALRYHMAAPALYVYNGGDVLIPNSAFSNFPFTVEMLYTLGLCLGSESAAQLIHWFCFALLCGLVYCLARHVRSRDFGIIAVAPLATTPFIPIFASWAFIEMGLALYLFLTFYCLVRLLSSLRGSENSEEEEEPPETSKHDRLVLSPTGWIILGGIFCGLSMGIKYTSGASFLIAIGVLLWKILRDLGLEKRQKRIEDWNRRWPKQKQIHTVENPLPRPIKNLVLFCVVAGLVASPWYIKNLIRFRNPLYPFLSSILPTPGWDEYNARFYRLQSGQKGELNEFRELELSKKIWDLATLPYSLTMGRKPLALELPARGDIPYFLTCRWKRLLPFNSEDGIRGGLFPFLASGDRTRLAPYRVGFGGWEVGPLWLLLVPLFLLVRKSPFETRFLAVIGAIHFLIWAVTYRDNRFLVPVFAFLALPAGYFLLACTEKRPGWHVFLRAFFLLILLRNVGWTVRSASNYYNPIPYIAGTKIDLLGSPEGARAQLLTGDPARLEYLSHALNTAGFIRPMMALNAIRKDGEKVLLVGQDRPYHCKPPYIGCDWFNTPPLLRMIHEIGDTDLLAEKLYAEGVRYVFINQGELDLYWWDYYLGYFYPEPVRAKWLNRYEKKPTDLPPLTSLSSWKVYHEFLYSGKYLTEIPPEEGGPLSEPFTSEEMNTRPLLTPGQVKVGVYRLIRNEGPAL